MWTNRYFCHTIEEFTNRWFCHCMQTRRHVYFTEESLTRWTDDALLLSPIGCPQDGIYSFSKFRSTIVKLFPTDRVLRSRTERFLFHSTMPLVYNLSTHNVLGRFFYASILSPVFIVSLTFPHYASSESNWLFLHSSPCPHGERFQISFFTFQSSRFSHSTPFNQCFPHIFFLHQSAERALFSELRFHVFFSIFYSRLYPVFTFHITYRNSSGPWTLSYWSHISACYIRAISFSWYCGI